MRPIDADALKENLFKYSAPEMVWDRADLNHKIDEMPTIELEQKTGRWIKLYPRAYKCSECKSWWEETEVDEIKGFTYCPKCGAKMEEEG